jgi:hypothetical protein
MALVLFTQDGLDKLPIKGSPITALRTYRQDPFLQKRSKLPHM